MKKEVREAAVDTTVQELEAKYRTQLAELEAQIDKTSQQLAIAQAQLERREADEAAAAKRAAQQKAAAQQAGIKPLHSRQRTMQSPAGQVPPWPLAKAQAHPSRQYRQLTPRR